ncbi:sialate O-acetylesterase [Mangrovimonas xylaniphaga]|uniref:sialate O-acetylesterase n=1 Tax=Mangrovimonas xylaniphaga TaxID=1645915 RepID=UPI0009E9EFC7|nr:sialate O-acetylesterase [Mangrovimonas xylaniphaga]
MNSKSIFKSALTILAFIVCSSNLLAQIRLPKLLSDGVVLQRDKELRIFGWASAGETVRLQFNKQNFETVSNALGAWEFLIPPQKAGGPYQMTFRGKNSIEVNNILFGDVWICSGQSNMEISMERVKEKYPKEIAASKNSFIRQIEVVDAYDFHQPQTDFEAPMQWLEANPETIYKFSAVAYFFAKELYDTYQVPIGLVNAALGGARVSCFLSEEALKEFPEDYQVAQEFKNDSLIEAITTADNKRAEDWYKELNLNDLGVNQSSQWSDPQYDDSHWSQMMVPGFWADQSLGFVNGAVWFRKTIDVPKSMAGKPAKLMMGRVVDQDFTYINGQQVGSISYQYPPRRYEVAPDILKDGKNVITVRVVNQSGRGGFFYDKPYYLAVGKDTIDLKGIWKYRLGTSMSSLASPTFIRWKPLGLYNKMIAPLTQFKIKGVLFYQGESNTYDPQLFAKQFPALISDWRAQWGQGDFPFLYVQLPNYMQQYNTEKESQWAQLREAQWKALSLPNTGMAVAIDAGEWNDIHPLNKEVIGKRLALQARSLAYGEQNLVASGPLFTSAIERNGALYVNFKNEGEGLVFHGDALKGFEIAGADLCFVKANATIENHTVVVNNPNIADPQYVRYAWANNPVEANLYNKEGLPASPFRNYDPETLHKVAWQGKQCAVVLTYDDALDVHLDNVAPLLDELGMKATFYISAAASGFTSRTKEWQTLASNGHELGNHTLYHPCLGNLPGREWVDPNYDLSTYSIEKMVEEIRLTNAFLGVLDHKAERTFAFTCGDMAIEDRTFMDLLRGDLVGARTVYKGIEPIDAIDPYAIKCFGVNGESGEELIAEVEKAMKNKGLLVFLFHGVGGGHSLNVSLEAHEALVRYLKAHEDVIWTDTMLDVVKNIKANQEQQ